MAYWWSSYGRFSPKSEQENRPHPGEVVAHYHEHSGKSVGEVAEECQVGIKMVGYYMEKLGVGLDLINHSRTLSAFLNIPPELLGLDSLHSQGDWWTQEGFPAFEKDETYPTHPKPGPVVKHYRLQKYCEAPPDQKSEWTQAGFAEALGLAEVTVRRMENSSQHLETISRRRMISFLLGIPPALLGLDSLEHPAPLISAKQRSVSLGREDIARYRKQLERLWSGYSSSHGQDWQKFAILRIHDLQESLSLVTTDHKSELLETEALYHVYLGEIAREQIDHSRVFSQFDQALAISEEIGKPDLAAMILIRRGAAHRERSDYASAAADIDGALQVVDSTHPMLRKTILMDEGRIAVNVAQDSSDITRALDFLDQAGALIRAGHIDEDPYFLNSNPGMYHLKRGDAYLVLGERFSSRSKTFLQDALDELVLARQLTPAHLTRRLALCNLTEAQVYLQMGKYPEATTLASEVLPVFQAIRSRLNLLELGTLYRNLQKSSYGTSPHVARLGWELSQTGLLTL